MDDPKQERKMERRQEATPPQRQTSTTEAQGEPTGTIRFLPGPKP